MARITKKPQAIRDLKETWHYIADDSPTSADKVVLQIEERLQLLLQFPQMGRKRPELERGIQGFVIDSYVVFYLAVEDGIEIVRVLHGARDSPAQFGQDS